MRKTTRAKAGEPMAFVRFAAHNDHGEDCLLWPYAIKDTGYGSVWSRETRQAHRAVLIERTGGDRAGMDAAHSCNVRQCVNPRHLRWATRIENCIDKQSHGTQQHGETHGMVKLTESDVREIRAMYSEGGISYVELAKWFDVSPSAIGDIVRRRRWAWLG